MNVTSIAFPTTWLRYVSFPESMCAHLPFDFLSSTHPSQPGPAGGFGGNAVNGYTTANCFFMGGGGGGGQQNNSVGSAGANGGGIILLKTNALTTFCSGSVTISANGANAASSGNDGAGSGGAGGSIFMSVGTYNVPSGCPLTSCCPPSCIFI